MDVHEVLKSKIGKIITLQSGKTVKIIDGFSCYDGEFFDVEYIDGNHNGEQKRFRDNDKEIKNIWK